MTFDLFMEIFGYIGTALVILSMLMTSVVKLRIINLSGALISMIYAIVVAAFPVAVLNGALIIIQSVQLARLYRAGHTHDPDGEPSCKEERSTP